LRGQDAVIEAFNPSAVPNQRNIAEAAVAADVKHILTPDFSTDTFNPHVGELLIYDGKKKAQDELETVVKESEGKLSWTAIIVGAWYDWAIDTGAFWINKNDRTIMRFGTGDQKYTISKLPHVADFVVHVLRNPEEFSNRPAYFASNTITTNQLIDIVKGIGEKEWKIIDIDFSDFLETGRQLWAKDTEMGVEKRNTTQAWALLGTIVLFNEENRYGADYEEKLEPGWDQGLDALARDLRALLTKA
jgi:nucleoside-diphosphate-sugar epimerase